MGRAELQQGRERRCVFVLTQQPSREVAFERVKVRADHFIQEWRMRPRARATPTQGPAHDRAG